MGLLPQPPRASGGVPGNPFMNVLGSVMRHAPMGVGPLYNLINSGVHVATGTANQWGTAPSFVGNLLHAIFPNFNPFASNAPATPGAPAAPAAPAPATPQPQAGPTFLSQGTNTGGVPPSTAWNAGRIPFAQTWQQMAFPGSSIGPTSGAITNPYNLANDRRDTATAPHIQGIPGFAAAYMNYVRSQNQL